MARKVITPHPYVDTSQRYVVDNDPDASSSSETNITIGSNCGNTSKKKYDPMPAEAAPRANNPNRTNAPAKKPQSMAETIDRESFIEQLRS
mmetsp:Transcript_17992/g.22659  ORF Transcript_17992/g.22659 Transcript_17992/m.22659 type:complete len:91 (+) Transcript_17992:1-273(+)